MRIDLNREKYEIIYRYKINKSSKDPTLISLNEYVDRLDELFVQAIKRTAKFDKVGLYLSGGIDSGLTGIYLKKIGVKVNAYTSAPWGKKSSEIPFAKINAERIGVEKHDIISLESNEYKEMISYIPVLYGGPHGNTSSVGLASLWKKSQINNEEQIYGAQGCDTENCSVPVQYLIFF